MVIEKTNIRFAGLLLVAVLCFSGYLALNVRVQVAAQNSNSSPSALPTATATSTPTPIPISAVVTQSERVVKRLSEIEKDLTDGSPVDRIRIDLSALQKQIDVLEARFKKITSSLPSLETLNLLEDAWKKLSSKSKSWNKTIEDYLEEVQVREKELSVLFSTWQELGEHKEQPKAKESDEEAKAETKSADGSEEPKAKEPDKKDKAETKTADGSETTAAGEERSVDDVLRDAQKEDVPDEINLKIKATIDEIVNTRKWLGDRRAELLKLQSRVVEQDNRIDTVLKKIKSNREAALSKLIVKDSPGIWNLATYSEYSGEEIGRSFTGEMLTLLQYANRYWQRFLIHLLAVLLLLFGLHRARKYTRKLVSAEPKLKQAMMIFEVPLASALLLTPFLARFIYPDIPDLLRAWFIYIFLVSGFFLLRRVVASPLVPVLAALVVFSFLDELRLIVSPFQLLTRLIFLTEMLGGIGFSCWLVGRKYNEESIESVSAKLYSRIRAIGIIAIVLFAASFVANALGYVSLSRIIANGVLRSGYIAFLFYAFLQVADGLVAFLCRVGPISRLKMVESERDFIQARIFRFLSFFAFGIWLYRTLVAFYIDRPATEVVVNAVTAELTIRTFSIALIDIIAFFFLIWLAFVVSGLIRFVLNEEIFARLDLVEGVPYAISTLLHYFLLVIGFLLGMAALGVDLTKFTLLAGAFGVGLGFGLREVVNNFVSGIILLFERPLKIGDRIQKGEYTGDVERIGLRATIIRTFNGEEVVVPNGQLLSEEFSNWSLSDERRRISIFVGVAYGTDPKEVIRLLKDYAKSLPGLDHSKEPEVLFNAFGNSSLDFEFRVWVRKMSGFLVFKSELTVGVHDTLTEAGIEIPFPQRDLHLKSVDAEASKALKSGRTDGKK